MNNPKSQIDEIFTELDISPKDLKQVGSPKKIFSRNLGISTLFVGFLAFISGFTLAPSNENLGYPFFPIILSPNFSISEKLRNLKPYIPIIFLNLGIILIGLISGYSVGSATKATTTIAPIRYGVHSLDR